MYSYRLATSADWSRVAALLSKVNLPLDGAETHLPHFVLALNPDGTMAGVAGIEQYGDVGLLRSVAVADQRKGVGRLLVEHMVATARQQGIRQLALLTTTAADYFPRFGFRVIPQSELPPALGASAELQGACPSTAIAMILDL